MMARLSRYRTIYKIDGQTMNHHTSSVFVRRFHFPSFDFKLERNENEMFDAKQAQKQRQCDGK